MVKEFVLKEGKVNLVAAFLGGRVSMRRFRTSV